MNIYKIQLSCFKIIYFCPANFILSSFNWRYVFMYISNYLHFILLFTKRGILSGVVFFPRGILSGVVFYPEWCFFPRGILSGVVFYPLTIFPKMNKIKQILNIFL